MKYISLIIIAIIVASFPVRFINAQDDWQEGSKSYFEQEWEHNEEESLALIPADLRADLLEIKKVDPERYGELLHDAVHSHYDEHYEYMEEFEKQRYDTDMMVQKLELQTEIIGVKYEYAAENEKKALVSKLKTTLEKLFDTKEKERSLNIQMLEMEIAELKESLTVRKQHRTEIINRRLNELLGRDDYFEW